MFGGYWLGAQRPVSGTPRVFTSTSDNNSQVQDTVNGNFAAMRPTEAIGGFYYLNDGLDTYEGVVLLSFPSITPQIGTLTAASLVFRLGDNAGDIGSFTMTVRAKEVLSPTIPNVEAVAQVLNATYTTANRTFVGAANTSFTLDVKAMLDELIASVGVVGLVRINFKIQPPIPLMLTTAAYGVFPFSDATHRPTLTLTY